MSPFPQRARGNTGQLNTPKDLPVPSAPGCGGQQFFKLIAKVSSGIGANGNRNSETGNWLDLGTNALRTGVRDTGTAPAGAARAGRSRPSSSLQENLPVFTIGRHGQPREHPRPRRPARAAAASRCWRSTGGVMSPITVRDRSSSAR